MRHSFAQRLALLMNENATSQYMLGKAIGATRQSIAQYLDEKTQPSAEKLCAIADYFNVPTDYLLGRVDYRSMNATVQGICEETGLSSAVVDTLMDLNKQSAIVDPKGEFGKITDWEQKKSAVYEVLNSLLTWPLLGDVIDLAEAIQNFHTAERIWNSSEEREKALSFFESLSAEGKGLFLHPLDNVRFRSQEIEATLKLIGDALCNKGKYPSLTVSMPNIHPSPKLDHLVEKFMYAIDKLEKK